MKTAMQMQTSTVELGSDDFHKCLNELRPHLGNHKWIWKILRLRTRKYKAFPFKAYSILKKFANPNKPYFISETAGGTKFVGDIRDMYAVAFSLLPDREDQLLDFLVKSVATTPGNFLDVGCNIGITAATVARHIQNGYRVLAFEPTETTAKCAAATFALNNLTNVVLFQMALSDKDGEMTFFSAPGHSDMSTASRSNQVRSLHLCETKVCCRKLDTLFQQGSVANVGLMKIDVEGHEIDVIKGGQKMIANESPDILFEYNYQIAPSLGWTADDITSIITDKNNYRFQVLDSDGCLVEYPSTAENHHYIDIFCSSHKSQ